MNAMQDKIRQLSDPVSRARSLVPLIKECRAETESLGRLPDRVWTALRDAGLLAIAKPALYGGPDLGVDVIFRVARELARGDGSAGWVYAVAVSHDQLVGLYPKEVQDAYWASARPMCASSYLPPAGVNARKVEGGYILNGRWPFCSGIDLCDWVAVGVFVDTAIDGQSAKDWQFLMIRTDAGEIIDDWQVMGLGGTGSKSIEVKDLFVPDAYVLRNADIAACNTPGRALHDNPVYGYSIWPLFGFSIIAAATGIARGALESTIADYRGRAKNDPSFLAKSGAIRRHLAEASAIIEAAELLYDRDLSETMERVNARQPLSDELRVRNRRDQAFIAKLCRQALDILMSMAGGRGVRTGADVQHALRDIYGVANHPGGNFDSAAESYGSVLFGGKPTEPTS